ncbi:MAG: hypothetical protein H6719_32545 [Sandaracinaceae bacterium]|nr:hypothetical protein [Sandaracinaceae bacterium]
MQQHRIVPLVLALTLGLAGCDTEMDGPLRPDGGMMMMMGPTTTYYADVAPLIARECLGCHVEGGIGPFPLDSYPAVVENAEYVVPAVMTGYMPPWMPDPACREFEHQRGLAPAERAVFERWVDEGMVEGDPADQPPLPPAPPTFTATHVAHMTEPYLPDATLPDDYRCFLLDHTFEGDSFLTGRNVVPGAGSLVHHVLVYAVPPDMVAAIEAEDARVDGPGYTCFGGPVPTAADAEGGSLGLVGLGGWVPGALPAIAREGRGTYVPAGSRLVMQVHYNLLTNDPELDSTEVHMQITTDPPEFGVTTFPTAIRDLNIRAGVAENRHRRVFRNYRSEAMQLTALTPHMHLLGTEISMNRVPAFDASGDPECLVDVPHWDFNWQQTYVFREDDPVTLAPGEGLELRCVYDNSDSNQPVINGEPVESRDVTWGEGTLDEMCLLYVSHETPWTGPPTESGCGAVDACMASCTTDDAQCLLACEGLDVTCRICNLEATAGCARDTCLARYAPNATCFDSCILSYVLLGGSFDRCMETECPTGAWAPARDCIAGVLEAGTCDSQLTACGIAR